MPPKITRVRWSAQNLPWGISFNEKNGTFSGTPEDVGEYIVPVTVETNYGKDTKDVIILAGERLQELRENNLFVDATEKDLVYTFNLHDYMRAQGVNKTICSQDGGVNNITYRYYVNASTVETTLEDDWYVFNGAQCFSYNTTTGEILLKHLKVTRNMKENYSSTIPFFLEIRNNLSPTLWVLYIIYNSPLDASARPLVGSS